MDQVQADVLELPGNLLLQTREANSTRAHSLTGDAAGGRGAGVVRKDTEGLRGGAALTQPAPGPTGDTRTSLHRV